MNNNYRTFKYTADTIDGVIQEFPKQFYLRCGQVQIIGPSQVRNYNGTECIQVMNVFLVLYNGQLLGNVCHKTKSGFLNFLRSVCNVDYLGINGGRLELNGCDLVLN